jgi:hypothetical protein
MKCRIAISFATLVLIVAPALAQTPPPPAPGQPQPQRVPGPPPVRVDPVRERPHELGFEVRDMPPQLNIVRGYLGLIGQLNEMAQDPTASGIAAVLGANEILKPRGADAVIQYFTKLLPEVKSEPVQRAIRIQLIEAYKQSGQQDKALEELRALITGAPTSAPH